jgi:transposase
VYWYFKQWEQAKVTEVMLAALREQARVQQGRKPQPSAGIIDSQSVKGADTVGRDSRGYDAGKKINGRKRFIVTDTLACSSWSSCSPRASRTVTVPGPPCSRRTWRNARSRQEAH